MDSACSVHRGFLTVNNVVSVEFSGIFYLSGPPRPPRLCKSDPAAMPRKRTSWSSSRLSWGILVPLTSTFRFFLALSAAAHAALSIAEAAYPHDLAYDDVLPARQAAHPELARATG